MGSGTTLPHLTSGKNVDEAAPCLEAAATASAVAAASRHGWLDLSKYQNRWGKPRNPNVILGILYMSSRLSESTQYLNHCMCCMYISCVVYGIDAYVSLYTLCQHPWPPVWWPARPGITWYSPVWRAGGGVWLTGASCGLAGAGLGLWPTRPRPRTNTPREIDRSPRITDDAASQSQGSGGVPSRCPLCLHSLTTWLELSLSNRLLEPFWHDQPYMEAVAMATRQFQEPCQSSKYRVSGGGGHSPWRLRSTRSSCV